MNPCRRTSSLAVALSFATAVCHAAAPTDNAVATYYDGPDGYPAWTDAVRWDHVIDMKVYAKGKTEFEKFENARDELAARGGGVLYYPAGTYDFSAGPFDGPNGRGLMLRSGVVIRGEAPAGKPNAARDGKLELPTRFVFGFQKKANVLDAGPRVSLWLENAVIQEIVSKPKGATEPTVEKRPRRLTLNCALRDGKVDAASAQGYTGLGGSQEQSDPVKVKVVEDVPTVKLEVSLEVTRVTNAKTGEKAVKAGAYTATFVRNGDGYAGTFTGTYDGTAVQGATGGQAGDARGEVPRDWNIVGLKPEAGQTIKDVGNVGICWVHLDGATIFFGPELVWGESWKTANDYKGPNVKAAWAARKADGTHPYDAFVGALKPKEGDPNSGRAVGAGKGRLVFGCVLERAAVLNDFETCARREPQASAGFGSNGYHMAKFAGRIAVYGSRVFIANNRLPESQGNFKYEQMTVKTQPRKGNDFFIDQPAPAVVLWDYNRTMGIDVNKDCWGLVGQTAKTNGLGYLAEGVAVLDNWVWNHGQKGYNLSGCWGVVRNNRNERRFLRGGGDVYGLGGGWTLTLDGYVQTAPGGGGMISDNLARAFDMAGDNLWIDGNFYHSTGSSPGIDGEGILCQASGGTGLRSWAITHNRHEKRDGHGGYIGPYNVDIWGLLIAWNRVDEFVGMVWRDNKIADLAFVANEAKEVKHYDKALIESKGVPAAPRDVKAEVYEGDAVRVTCADGSDNEIGFRVDRQIAGGKWAAIAYRPPRIEGSEHNPQAWVDFLAPTGKPLNYRVVAVNADDKDDGASGPTPAIVLAAVSVPSNGK